MKYQWILFDADETLFSFNSYLGLQAVLACYGIEFSQDDYEAFQAVNKPCGLHIKIKKSQLNSFKYVDSLTLQKKLEKTN